MSVWEKIQEAIDNGAYLVNVPLSRREVTAVYEARENWANKVLDEASAWDVLYNFGTLNEWWPFKKKSQQSQPTANMTGQGQKAIKGLDPREVQLIRHFVSNAKAKQGESGEIMALPPKEWQRIKQEIESQPEYYDKILGNVISAAGLTKKIEDQLALAMGRGPASAKREPIDPGPDMDGKPDEAPPVIHGKDQFDVDPEGKPQAEPTNMTPAAPPTAAPAKKARSGPRSPSRATAADPEAVARRKRVAAQDAQMMGGKTKPIGRIKVK